MRLEMRCASIRLHCLAALFVCVSVSYGQQSTSRDTAHRLGAPVSGQRHVVGIKNQSCSTCHFNSAPKNEWELPPDLRSASNDGWILGDELKTWSRHDHHYDAFAILQNDQSKLIARQLGVVDENGESLIHRDRRCLSCHSSVPYEQMEAHGDIVDLKTDEDPRYTIGVSCEACHGPAGKDAAGTVGWGSAHFSPGDDPASQKDWWRLLSAGEKFDRFGYWDIHSIETQARVCLSCHLGNVEQKKIITHEMYAAGHPPLPSFELSQFIRQMPRHWNRLDEKPTDVLNRFLSDRQRLQDGNNTPVPDFQPGDVAMTRASMVSALVALEESMWLTAELIDVLPESEYQPELANYACFACHHELVRDGWRKSRRLTATPGRPTLHEWPMTLARIVELSVKPDGAASDLESKYSAVSGALNSQPFGNRKDLSKAAKELANESARLSEQLRATKIDRKLAQRFFRSIGTYGARTDMDYDASRQLVWAGERTDYALNSANSQLLSSASEQQPIIDAVFSSNRVLTEFEQDLLLWLRTNRKDPTPTSLGSPNEHFTRMQSAIDISQALNRIAKFDPARTREIFERLVKEPADDDRN